MLASNFAVTSGCKVKASLPKDLSAEVCNTKDAAGVASNARSAKRNAIFGSFCVEDG